MPGTHNSGRPGGNPALSDPSFQKEHGFKRIYDYSEPLTTQLQLKITSSMAMRLQQLENKSEFIRQVLADALDRIDA